MELIDRRKLVFDFWKGVEDCSILSYEDTDELMENAPTVDAVEVVHGRWFWSEKNECWFCSYCEMSALNNYRGNSTDSNYCPNCGAKMDLK